MRNGKPEKVLLSIFNILKVPETLKENTRLAKVFKYQSLDSLNLTDPDNF
jgi:hypothetical protein